MDWLSKVEFLQGTQILPYLLWVQEHWIISLIILFIVLQIVQKIFGLTRRARYMMYKAQGVLVAFNMLMAAWEKISKFR